MNKGKFLAYTLIMAMTMTTMPVQVFAQDVTTKSQLVAEVNTPRTTESALEIETNCLFPVKENLIKTNLVKVYSGEIKKAYSLSYEWDDEWFFRDNTVYNRALGKTASILSALAYCSSEIDYEVNEPGASTYSYELAENASDVTTANGVMGVMETLGFEDVAEYNLRNYYNDDHMIQFNIGHKKVNNGNEEKEALIITVRGTRGEMEWISNIIMGQEKEFGKVPQWSEKQNHMGLDITANRVVELVEQYMAENNVDTKNATFMITGHSRGGGVANLVGKKLEDKNFDTYTYTFAAPNTTLAEDAEYTYPSIINIVSEEDLVPAIPMEAWGFKKYGRTVNTDMNLLLKLKFATMIGTPYMSSSILNGAIKEIGKITENRETAFEYTYAENTKLKKSFSSEAKREEALKAIPEACLPYAQIELSEGKGWFGKKTYDYTMTQSPMYFITAAGLSLAGTMSPTEFLAFEVADAYKAAKTKLIVAGIGGLSHPHYMETYILIAYSLQLKGVRSVDDVSLAELYIEVE